MAVTATEVGRYTYPDQTADGNLNSGYKWFSLQDNKLDGSYHPLPADGSAQMGWWGTTLSDSGGNLNPAPKLTLEYSRPVHTLRIVGDGLLNEYPVNFTIELYNGTDLLYTKTITGNNQVIWQEPIPQTYDVTKIVVTVFKVNKPRRTVKIVEALNPFEIFRSDQIKPKMDSTVLITPHFSSADTITVTSTDISQPVTALVPATDSLVATLAESSFFELYEFIRQDTLKLKIVDVSIPITVQFDKSDNLKVKATETVANFIVELTKAATLTISPDIEAQEITVELPTRQEILEALLNESPNLRNIHTVMNDPVRKVYGKVQITYSDPFLDETITVTASGSGRYTEPQDTADNIQTSEYKWFSLHNNRLDGSFHPLPSDQEKSVGWWSDIISDASGVFATPPTLTVEFEPRPVFELKVVGDDKLNEYPVDFIINLYDNSNTLLYSENVTGNNQVVWQKDIETVTNVTKMELVIHKINKPNSTAKITEFYTAVQETYKGDDLFSMNLLEEQEFDSGTLPIGNISANEIKIRLNNIERRFDPSNLQSPLHNQLKKNRRIKAWLGAEVRPREIEWYPLGEFWTLDWRIPEFDVYAETTGRDRLELMRLTTFESSQVYQGYSLYQLAELILQDYGLEPDQYIIDPALQDITVDYAWFDRISHREALKKIAAAILGKVYVDRQGRVVVRVFEPTVKPIFEFNNDNIFNKDQPLAWSQIANYVEVKAKPLKPGPLENVVEDMEEFTVPAGSEVRRTYFFNYTPVIEAQAPTISAGPDISIKSYTVYAWGMEVVFQNAGTTDQTVSQVTIQGKKLQPAGGKVAIAKDEKSIRDNGLQKITIENEFIQTLERAQEIADTLLITYKDPRHDLSVDARGNIALQLGDRIKTSEEYFIVHQEIEWDGGLKANITARKVGDD